MTEETGTALAVRSSADLAQVTELEKILLSDEKPDVVDDPAVVAKEIVARLLGAESDEELETMGAATGWRELEGIPIKIKGFHWRPSSFDEGAPIFFVVQGFRLDTGEAVVLTTGSYNVLAQLTNMAKRSTLVDSIRQLKRAETATAAGFYPLWLETPEEVKAELRAAAAAEAGEPAAA